MVKLKALNSLRTVILIFALLIGTFAVFNVQIRSVLATDTSPPTFGAISANTTKAGVGVRISCAITDNVLVSSWGIEWNNTGSTVNVTKIAVSSAAIVALYDGIWNGTVGDRVWVQFWANDSSNNPAYSNVRTFVLTINSTTLLYDDFSSGGFSLWTSTTGTPTVVASPFTARKAAFISASGQQYATKLLGAEYTDVSIDLDVTISRIPYASGYDMDLARIGNNASWGPLIVRIENVGGVGRFDLRDDMWAQEKIGSTSITLNQTYHVMLVYGSSNNCSLYLSGNLEATFSSVGFTADRVDIGGGNQLAAKEYIEMVDVEASGVYIPPPPWALSITANPTSATVYVGSSQNFTASISGGTTPYNAVQWLNNTNHAILATGSQYAFSGTSSGSYQFYASVTDSESPPQTATSSVVTVTVTTVPTNVTSAPGYPVNAFWVQDQGWSEAKPWVLDNLQGIVADCAAHHINYVLIQVGWWNSSNPAHLIMNDGAGHNGVMIRSHDFYINVVNAFHAVNISVIAWVGNLYGSPTWGKNLVQPTPNIVDITAANVNNTVNDVVGFMNSTGMGSMFDGYDDDCETYLGDNTTNGYQSQIDYLNNITAPLHAIGKLNMPCVGLDWQSQVNMYLHVDYIMSMFYDGGSTFESSYASMFWREEFGMWYSLPNVTAPSSPLLLGVFDGHSNQHPLSWQLTQISNFITLYGTYNLSGFCIWTYECMGAVNPDDWSSWETWIMNVSTSPPTLYAVTVESSPFNVPMTFDGRVLGTPYTRYGFSGTLTSIAPLSIMTYQNSPLQCIANGVPANFGGTTVDPGGSGYNIWTYCNGPYTINATSPIFSYIYLYTLVAGNAMVAIYDARTYADPPGIGPFPGGLYAHPNNETVASQAVACQANTWNIMPIAATSLSPGTYFIIIKCQQSLMMSGGVGFWGQGQVMSGGYDSPFPANYPTSSLLGAVGGEFACYIPLAPIQDINYNFAHWEDSTTSPTRLTNVNATSTIIATYVQGAVPTPQNFTLTIAAAIGGITVPANGTYTVLQGAVASITATPSAGYVFDHWMLDGANVTLPNPYFFSMDTNHNFAPFFTATTSHYQYTFQFLDLDGHVISPISWDLYNGTSLMTYRQGQATLLGGIYTLQTYYKGSLISTELLPTSIYGNTTVTVNTAAKSFAGGNVVCNSTISSLSFNSQTATNITFTAVGTSGPYQITLDVPSNPTAVTKNGVAYANWIYDSPNHVVTIFTPTLSVWELDFSTPTGPVIPPVSTPPIIAYTLTVIVTSLNQNIQGATVTVTGGYSGATGINGLAAFLLLPGTYAVTINYQGTTQNKTVTLASDQQVTFDVSSTASSGFVVPLYVITITVVVVLMAIISSIVIIRRRRR